MINLTIIEGVVYIVDMDREQAIIEVQNEFQYLCQNYLTIGLLSGIAIGFVIGFSLKIYLDKRKKK